MRFAPLLLIDALSTLGFFAVTLIRMLKNPRRFRLRETLDHLWIMGVLGTPSALFCLCMLSGVMIFELSFHMALIIRQDAMVPSFTTMLLIRELGPVVTAMLLASRVGAAISAEISTLKVTGQLDALVLCGVDLGGFLAGPRIVACFISSIALTLLSIGGSLVVAAVFTSAKLGITPQLFLGHLFLFTESTDITCCLLKAGIFGLLIPAVACYSGLGATRNSSGVGTASTQSVVRNSVMIIALDFLISWFWYA